MNADQVKDIRITDPYVKRLVNREQKRRGIKTATKAVGVLIVEYLGNPDRQPNRPAKASA